MTCNSESAGSDRPLLQAHWRQLCTSEHQMFDALIVVLDADVRTVDNYHLGMES